MLSLDEQTEILKTIPKGSPYIKYIKSGYTLEEAKENIQKNNKSYKLYWISRGYTEEEASTEIKKRNPTMKLYWISRGYTEEEASIEIKKRSKNFKEYWISRGYTEEDALTEIKKRNKNFKEYWVSRGYTEEDALTEIKKYKNKLGENLKQHFTRSQNVLCKEFWMKRGYSEEESIILAKNTNRNRAKNISSERRSEILKNYYTNLSEEDKLKKLERDKKHSIKMKAKNKTHSPIFMEYWINKGYTIEESKIQVNNVKYGNRISGNSHASKIETKCITELSEFLQIDIVKNKWIRIEDKNFCADGKYNNFIFEFNGTNFHLDTRFYDKMSKNPKGKTYEEVKCTDNIKLTYYEKKGYDVFIIWEYDYINNKIKLFNYIKDLINGKKSNNKRICWDSASIFNKC